MSDSENEIIIKLIKSILYDMGGDNPGATNVLREILTYYTNDFFALIEKMRKYNIVDYHIWILYKDYDKNISKFVTFIQKLE